MASTPTNSRVTGEFTPDGKPVVENSETNSQPVPLQSPAKTTVLLVEDEDLVRGVARRLLRSMGFSVIEARNGQEGLEIAAREPAVDLVLSDVMMPTLCGPEMVVEIRKSRPTLPVLFMSGYSDSSLLVEELERPHTDLLLKPFTLPNLLSKIERLLPAKNSGTPHRRYGTPI